MSRLSRRDLARMAAAGALAAAAGGRPARGWAQASSPAGELAGDIPGAVGRQLARVAAGATGPFKPDWDSLMAYRVPAWFRDAKFGVFIHWGVYSAPAFGNEWYPRNMYIKGSAAYEYHRAVYGDQSKFGYKDFIPMFKAERFDPEAWIDLFAGAGARYVVPVAEHCDGFAMYDSSVTVWDAARMGPRRDVVGALEKATRARGLRFGVSSHRAEHWFWYDGGRAYPSDVNDPRYVGLYGPAAPRNLPGDPPGAEPDPAHLERWLPPSQAFLDDWLARTSELVDKYQPELIYLDWWINHPAFEPDLRRLAAYYYDQAASRGQGPVLTFKEMAMPEGAAVLDIERGKLDELRLTPWQTDTSVSVNSWGYVRDDVYRTPRSLICDLVDVVSKNGNLLLNVGPRADGTIPEEARAVLEGIGAWLGTNGEAIYGSRPWVLYGEGPTNAGRGEKKELAEQRFTPADIRFTTKGGALYAIGLERPADGTMLVKTLYEGSPYMAPVAEVSLVGGGPLAWRQGPEGLAVSLPAGLADTPYTVRIRPRA